MQRNASRHRRAPGDFHALMGELLRHMQITPSAKAEPEVYAFTFDGRIEVRILSRQPGTLDIVAPSLGKLRDGESQAVLRKLLEQNRYTPDRPCMSLGVDPASGKMYLWARHPLDSMDLESLVGLLHDILERTDAIHACLEGKPAAHGVAAPGSRRPLHLRLHS